MIFNEIFYENNQPFNDIFFVRQMGELCEDVNYNISKSSSPTHTIGILTAGKLNLKFEDEKIVLHQGQCVFFPRDISYTITADKLTPPHFIWINIRGKLIDEIARVLFCGKYVLSDADLRSCPPLLRTFLAERKNNMTDISSLIFKMLMGIYNSKISIAAETKNFSEYEFYISNSIQYGFSVISMADYFHCSADTINRQFKKIHGVTPYRYYQNMRAEISKTMLRQTELTIDDIAERLHFNDRNHFSRCFKKITGYAPAKYRTEFCLKKC